MTLRRAGRIALAIVISGLLGGCGALLDPKGFGESAAEATSFLDYSGWAMNSLTYGELSNAERYALAALRNNPKDPIALYVAGVVYQATGRYELARQYYEVLLANHPQMTITTVSQGMPQVRSLVDVAQANLVAVDKLTGRFSPRTAAQSGRMPDASPLNLEPASPLAPPRGMVSAAPLDDPTGGGNANSNANGMRTGGTQAEANVASRFKTLKRLLDEGLVTPDEYAKRRSTNLGALTPYSAPVPPAQGLERPAPNEQQVVDRIKALSAALENRAISPAEHAGERAAILDALLPAEPRKVDLPVLPPRDVMEAATAVGRVERLHASGLVSAEEARRERDTVERVLDTQLAKIPVSGTATGLRQGLPPANGNGKNAKTTTKGGGNALMLGTAASEEAAQQTWAKIQGKFPEELGGMGVAFRSVDLGEKGTRWRVIAGPLKSADEARKMCKVLKLHRQSCDTTAF